MRTAATAVTQQCENAGMRIAIAQFAVDREPDRNIETIRTYAMQASANGARVLLLPEGIIARDATDPY